jgi:hypothetical protein
MVSIPPRSKEPYVNLWMPSYDWLPDWWFFIQGYYPYSIRCRHRNRLGLRCWHTTVWEGWCQTHNRLELERQSQLR